MYDKKHFLHNNSVNGRRQSMVKFFYRNIFLAPIVYSIYQRKSKRLQIQCHILFILTLLIDSFKKVQVYYKGYLPITPLDDSEPVTNQSLTHAHVHALYSEYSQLYPVHNNKSSNLNIRLIYVIRLLFFLLSNTTVLPFKT